MESEEKQKALAVAMIGIIACAAVGGYLLGKRVQFAEDRGFYDTYINSSCYCSEPLVYKGNLVSYGEEPGFMIDYDPGMNLTLS